MANIPAGPVRNANAEFMCNYGGLPVSAQFVQGNLFDGRWWTDVAFPIVGGGRTVTQIEIKDERAPSTWSPSFQAGLYNTTQSGIPGILIASGTGKGPRRYRTVTIGIPPTTLKRHQRYWVVEEVEHFRHVPDEHGINEVCWKPARHARRKAYVRQHSWGWTQGGSNSSTTPWTRQTTGAYLVVK